MRLRIPILFTSLLVALVAPVAAQGAQQQFYAAPSGSGSACSQTAPCALATAMENAKAFDQDELILASGSYGSLAHPLAPLQNEGFNLVQGTPGAPAPQLFIDTTGAGPPNTDVFALQLTGAATLRDVAITALGSNDEGIQVGSLDHVLVTDTAGAIACQPLGNIRDSACIALASGALALTDGGSDYPATPDTVEYDNDTFYAPGGTAAYLWPVNFALTVKATDTIFDGATFDIDGSGGGGAGGTLDVVPSYDAFSQVDPVNLIPPPKGSSSYHIDSTAPTFADPVTGDVQEAPGSSTIDAGTEESAGGITDLAGGPRTIGPATDIGAYEAPEVPTISDPSTSGVAQNTLTVLASVNPNSADTEVHVDYGTTTAYGAATAPIDVGAGLTAVPVSIPLAGLIAGAVYHLRVVAINEAGTSDGTDVAVATFAIPPTSTGPITTLALTTDTLAPGALTASPTATVAGNSAAVLLTCGPPIPASSLGCHGTLRLIIKHKRRMHKGRHTLTKTITIASASFTLVGGQRKTVAVHLAASILTSLKAARRHRLPVTLQILRSDGAPERGVPLTLVLAPTKAKHKQKQ